MIVNNQRIPEKWESILRGRILIQSDVDDRIGTVIRGWRPTYSFFFPLDQIEAENRGILGTGYGRSFVQFDRKFDPGHIDLLQAVYIGSIDPDVMIAFDFRSSQTDPAIVYMATSKNNSWTYAADNIEGLMRKLLIHH